MNPLTDQISTNVKEVDEPVVSAAATRSGTEGLSCLLALTLTTFPPNTDWHSKVEVSANAGHNAKKVAEKLTYRALSCIEFGLL